MDEDYNYINEFCGIKANLGGNWVFYSDEELAELSGLTANILDNEGITAALEAGSVYYDLYASDGDDICSINITYEYLGPLLGAMLDVDDYIEITVDNLYPAFEELGMDTVDCTLNTVDFAGEERSGIHVTAGVSGFYFYEQIVCLKVGDYICSICIATYGDDYTEYFLDCFVPYP